MSKYLGNAAARFNFVSELYDNGVEIEKARILDSIDQEYALMHIQGDIHIHDLEGFGKVYNCCAPRLKEWLITQIANETFECPQSKIVNIFECVKELITKLALCQTGGIGFSNYDDDMAFVFDYCGVEYEPCNLMVLKDCHKQFIKWINTSYTRYNREPYYLTFNIGLSVSQWGRAISQTLITAFNDSPRDYTRPNIVFKVSSVINGKGSVNYDLYMLSLKCTTRRMIPTYLLLDSAANKDCSPKLLGIMGCRTKVYDNMNGQVGTEGRGNISCVSINLPRIALKSGDIDQFYDLLNSTMNSAKGVLQKRTELTGVNGQEYLSFVLDENIWNTNNIHELLNQGTMSIGFIGLSECVEVLTGKRPYECTESGNLALDIIKHMKKNMDMYSMETGMTFSLIASSGEMISGRFCSIDKESYPHSVQDKGFYTNSFHVNVGTAISIYDKLNHEAPFHSLCNGGCITYLELRSAPIGNPLAIEDGIEIATSSGISYLGFNFPYDICKKCGAIGTFDNCPKCGSDEIKRIRRVSGYLEDIEFFTAGKQAEVKNRKANS